MNINCNFILALNNKVQTKSKAIKKYNLNTYYFIFDLNNEQS